jgi:hypothetical protein
MAKGMTSPEARSRGELCAVRSCMTSMPRSARLKTSAHVLMTRPWLSTMDWLKLNPFKLNAMVETPMDVNQVPRTGHKAKKKCKARELLNVAYRKMRRPKYP